MNITNFYWLGIHIILDIIIITNDDTFIFTKIRLIFY